MQINRQEKQRLFLPLMQRKHLIRNLIAEYITQHFTCRYLRYILSLSNDAPDKDSHEHQTKKKLTTHYCFNKSNDSIKNGWS